MLTSNEKNIMIKHILYRKESHLKNILDNHQEDKIEIWSNFYDRLLLKYGYREDDYYA